MPLIAVLILGTLIAFPSAADPNLFDVMQSQIIKASDAVKDRVVHVEVVTKQNQKNIKVQGSGLILDSLGYVVTNEHVVDKAEKVTITVPGIEDQFDAQVVGTDKMTDLAVLKMEHPLRFQKLAWADIARVRVGDWAIAIGNPYGLDRTVSLGIISAKGRAVPAQGLLNDFLQTDAMIDMGSSGGPLVNLKGEILGVNSMIMGRGIGFTVPADIVREIIAKLIRGGEIERSWVGILMQPLTRDHAAYFGIPEKKGVIVTGVFESSPAEKAGLQTGDIVTAIDGKEVVAEKQEDLNHFKRIVADHAVGETVTLNVYSPKRKSFRTVKIKTSTQPTVKPKELDLPWGFIVQEITPLLYRENFLFTDKGVVVTYVRNGSEAEIAGLETWDIVQSIDEIEIRSISDFEKIHKKIKNKQRVMLTVQRNRDIYFILIQKYGAMEKE